MPDDVQWPRGVTAAQAPVLDVLADLGIGEGDFGESHDVPAGLLELAEVLEYQEATGYVDERTDSERHADEDAWHNRNPGIGDT